MPQLNRQILQMSKIFFQTKFKFCFLFTALLCIINSLYAQHAVLTVPTGHLSTPRHIAVSPNGKWMASTDFNHVIIWNALNGSQLRSITTQSGIESISWFPDNNTLAIQTEDYPMDTIVKINIQTGQRIVSAVFKDVYRMKVSSDGKYIFLSGQNGSLRVADAASMQVIQTIEADNKKMQLSIFTTPDEKYCIGMNFTKLSVNRFEPGVGGNKTGTKLFDVKPPFGEVRRYQFSPDGKSLIALVGPDFGIVCFDIENENVRWSVRSEKSFDDFGFTADGKNIITLHEDAIEMYALASGTKTGSSIPMQKGYGTDMIVSGGMAYLWDEWHGEFRITRYNPLTAQKDIEFTGDYQDGEYAGISNTSKVFGQYGTKSPLRIWNFDDGRVISSFTLGEKDRGFGFSPDGNSVAFGKFLRIKDTRTGKEKMQLPYDEFYAPDGIVFSANENYLCTWENGDFNVMLYDLQSQALLWKTNSKKPYGVMFSPDESLVAIACEKGETLVFDTRTGTQKAFIDVAGAADYNTTGLAFINNNELMVACGRTINTYNAETGSLIKNNYTLSGSGYINSFQLSDDGRTAMILSKANAAPLRTINIQSGNTIAEINNDNQAINYAGLVSGGKFLVTVGGDDLTILWDAKTGKKLLELYSYNNEWLAVTPDGRFDGSQDAISKLYFTKGTETIPLQSLYEKYYTPHLISRIIQGETLEPVADIDDIKNLPTVKIYYASASRNLFVSDDIASYDNSSGIAEITVKASCENDVIDEIRLFHNGKIINIDTRNLFVDDDSKTVSQSEKKYTVNLLPGENTFRAVALNSQRTESNPDVISIIYNPANNTTDTKPQNNTIYNSAVSPVDKNATLYLLVIGINAYDNNSMKLNYALADATSFKDAIEKDAGSLVSDVKTYFITDKEADKNTINTAFESIRQKARPQDVFIFYYAGHGVIGKDKEFYLVPKDVSNLKNVQEELLMKGISASQLQQYAAAIAAQKQVFILDACQSAGAFENLLAEDANQQRNIALLARSTGTHWMAASGSKQFANEFASLGHGLFTYTLLQALDGDASINDMITVNGLKNYLQQAMPELMKKYRGSVQYPSSYGFGIDFPVEMKR